MQGKENILGLAHDIHVFTGSHMLTNSSLPTRPPPAKIAIIYVDHERLFQEIFLTVPVRMRPRPLPTAITCSRMGLNIASPVQEHPSPCLNNLSTQSTRGCMVTYLSLWHPERCPGLALSPTWPRGLHCVISTEDLFQLLKS